MNVDRRRTIFVCVVSADHPFNINVFKIIFNCDRPLVENELKLPRPEANLLKLLSDEELQL